MLPEPSPFVLTTGVVCVLVSVLITGAVSTGFTGLTELILFILL
jgi:hypothetical protein